MRKRDEKGPSHGAPQLRAETADERPTAHVVFDFTGLEQPDVGDLSLILTARLLSAPSDNVWVRSLPRVTGRVLRALGLSHLFRPYPNGSDQLN